MLCRTLVAVLLCLSAWAADRVAVGAGADLSAASTASWLTAAPCDSDSSNDQWSTRRNGLSTPESGWKSQLQDVELTSASWRDAISAIRRGGLLTRAAPQRSPHLRHTPLLI